MASMVLWDSTLVSVTPIANAPMGKQAATNNSWSHGEHAAIPHCLNSSRISIPTCCVHHLFELWGTLLKPNLDFYTLIIPSDFFASKYNNNIVRVKHLVEHPPSYTSMLPLQLEYFCESEAFQLVNLN
jgi:hypothetical protein